MSSIFGETRPAYENPEPEETDTTYEAMSDGSATVTMVPSDSGLFHTYVPMKNLVFKMAPNESVIEHLGAFITFGTDRPGTLGSGAGSQGFQGSATIDIVVGRGAGARGGRGLKKNTRAQPMFTADSSRIYISQLTEIDKNFGIAQGVPGNLPGMKDLRAGIGIKSDDIRIIARNSLKIITGRAQGFTGAGDHGESNSLGGKSQAAPTIQLIAGNYSDSRFVYGGLKDPFKEVSYLQPAIKGHNMIAAMKELMGVIESVWSAVYNLGLIQTGYNGILGVDPYKSWVAAAAPPAGLGNMTFVLQNLWAARSVGSMWEQYYLEHHGDRYIASPNVWLT